MKKVSCRGLSDQAYGIVISFPSIPAGTGTGWDSLGESLQREIISCMWEDDWSWSETEARATLKAVMATSRDLRRLVSSYITSMLVENDMLALQHFPRHAELRKVAQVSGSSGVCFITMVKHLMSGSSGVCRSPCTCTLLKPQCGSSPPMLQLQTGSHPFIMLRYGCITGTMRQPYWGTLRFSQSRPLG